MTISFINVFYGCVVEKALIDQHSEIKNIDQHAETLGYGNIDNDSDIKILIEELMYMKMPHDQEEYEEGFKNPVYMGIYIGQIFNRANTDDTDHEFDLEKMINAKTLFDSQVKKLQIESSIKKPKILICNIGCPCCR
jgi:hypothetical protein